MLQPQGQPKVIGANPNILSRPDRSCLTNWLPEAGASGYLGYRLFAKRHPFDLGSRLIGSER
jgi:hypothetical protein